MSSPLLPYANTRLLVFAPTAVLVVNGRITAGGSSQYLLKCFMKRIQYSGVSSGSKKLPLESQLDGRMLPGASGDQFYYRGYALEAAAVSGSFALGDSETGLTWAQIQTQEEWMLPGAAVKMKFGDDPFDLYATIERSSGIFGGAGIDEIIYREIGGVQIQVKGGEVQN
jgi:hypothetical protein